MRASQRRIELDLSLSRSINLADIVSHPKKTNRPKEFSRQSWNIITKATKFIHQLEIDYLDDLITSCVAAIIRAEGCGCAQCRKNARLLSKKLDEELIRQTAIWETNSFHNEERELIERDIELGMYRLWEKQIEAQDDRWEKLRTLLNKVRKDTQENRGKKHLKLDENDEILKQQLLAEIKALRQKRRNRKK